MLRSGPDEKDAAPAAAQEAGSYTTASSTGAIRALLEPLPYSTPVVLVDPAGSWWVKAETRKATARRLVVAIDPISPVDPDQLKL